MTAGDAIKRALRLIGAIDPGEDPSSTEMANGLVSMNGMLAMWSTGRNAIYAPVTKTHALTAGTATYNIGSGQTIDTPRPKRILAAWLRLNEIDYPLSILPLKNYAALSLKTTSGTPEEVYHELTYPVSTLTLYPEPDAAYTMHLKLWSALPTYTSVTDDLALPAEYEQSICFNLAGIQAPEYGLDVSNTVASIATSSLDAIKALNAQPKPRLSTDPLRRGRRSDIFGDE